VLHYFYRYGRCTSITWHAGFSISVCICSGYVFQVDILKWVYYTAQGNFINNINLFFSHSGFIAERVNLRYFLSIAMLASGISCYLFGIAKPYNIHNLWYFIFVQVNINNTLNAFYLMIQIDPNIVLSLLLAKC